MDDNQLADENNLENNNLDTTNKNVPIFKIIRTYHRNDEIGWVIGAIVLFFFTIISAGRLTLVGQFLDDVIFTFLFGWFKYLVYVILLLIGVSWAANVHIKTNIRISFFTICFLILSGWLIESILQIIEFSNHNIPLWSSNAFMVGLNDYLTHWWSGSIFSINRASLHFFEFNGSWVTLYDGGGFIGNFFNDVLSYTSVIGSLVICIIAIGLTFSTLIAGHPLAMINRRWANKNSKRNYSLVAYEFRELGKKLPEYEEINLQAENQQNPYYNKTVTDNEYNNYNENVNFANEEQSQNPIINDELAINEVNALNNHVKNYSKNNEIYNNLDNKQIKQLNNFEQSDVHIPTKDEYIMPRRDYQNAYPEYKSAYGENVTIEEARKRFNMDASLSPFSRGKDEYVESILNHKSPSYSQEFDDYEQESSNNNQQFNSNERTEGIKNHINNYNNQSPYYNRDDEITEYDNKQKNYQNNNNDSNSNYKDEYENYKNTEKQYSTTNQETNSYNEYNNYSDKNKSYFNSNNERIVENKNYNNNSWNNPNHDFDDYDEENEYDINSIKKMEPLANNNPLNQKMPFPVNKTQNINSNVAKASNSTIDKSIIAEVRSLNKINKNYVLPPLDLLNPNKSNGAYDKANSSSAANKTNVINQIFQTFGVGAQVSNSIIGPTITKFEISLEPGVKVNKIISLENDLKLALATPNIRMEAPIQGKSAVGLEVANQYSKKVPIRALMENIPNDYKHNKLTVVLGETVTGEFLYAELNRMPHLLIAGSTGSGKSVCINTIIASLILRSKPYEVRLLLIDPKQVELSVYNELPHLLAPVISNTKEANNALKKLISEMERRYSLLTEAGVRNIESYNKKETSFLKKLPYIVVVIDELADLMITTGREVEESIMRITQLARAAGIHLILATQRPSTNIITGVIKNNVPSRIAFAVASGHDSRTILDHIGAERLIGQGDMLYSPIGQNHLVRAQGAFISDEEIERLVEYCKSQQTVNYDPEFMDLSNDYNSQANMFSQELDELYDDVKQFIILNQRASTSLIQRKFSLGYNRASRIIESLEENGVIGPQNGAKPREVFYKPE